MSYLHQVCNKSDKTVSSKLLLLQNLASKLVITKGNSRASKYYIRPNDVGILMDLKSFKGQSVTLPDNLTIAPSHIGQLPLSSQLSSKAKQSTVLPQLKNASLVSLGQLCDENCEITLTKNSSRATKVMLLSQKA